MHGKVGEEVYLFTCKSGPKKGRGWWEFVPANWGKENPHNG